MISEVRTLSYLSPLIYNLQFQFKSLSTDEMKETFLEFYRGKEDLTSQIDWDSWLYKPGRGVVS